MKMEPAQPMSCSVSNSFEAENNAEIDGASVSTINANFELSPEDISLVFYIFSKDAFADSLSSRVLNFFSSEFLPVPSLGTNMKHNSGLL